MKPPRPNNPKRPTSAAGKVARDSKQAAIQLVRLEFDAARLEDGISQAKARISSFERQLSENTRKRSHLVGLLDQSTNGKGPA